MLFLQRVPPLRALLPGGEGASFSSSREELERSRPNAEQLSSSKSPHAAVPRPIRAEGQVNEIYHSDRLGKRLRPTGEARAKV